MGTGRFGRSPIELSFDAPSALKYRAPMISPAHPHSPSEQNKIADRRPISRAERQTVWQA